MNHSSMETDGRMSCPFTLKNRLTPIALLTFIFFFNILARFVWGPLLVHIENELGIGHAAAGALFIYITAGYFMGMIVSGFLSYKINHRKTIIVSCYILGILVILTSVSESFLFFRMMLIAIGATAGLYLPSGVASLTYNLKEKDFGKAFAIHEISPSLALVVGPILVEFGTGFCSWRTLMWPMGLALCLSGFLYGLKDTTGDYRGDPLTIGNMKLVFSMPAFWVMLVLFMMGIAASMAIYSMLPLYMVVERGLDQTSSNLLVSTSRVVAMFSPYVTGWMITRYQTRSVMTITIFLAGLAVIAVGLCPNQWLWLPMFLQPVLATAIFPPAYAILTGLTPSGLLNIVILLMMPTAMFFGGGVFPTVIGAFGDAGQFHAGFVWTGLFVTVSSLLGFGIKLNPKSTNEKYDGNIDADT